MTMTFLVAIRVLHSALLYPAVCIQTLTYINYFNEFLCCLEQSRGDQQTTGGETVKSDD